MDNWVQPSHQFLVALSKFVESLRLRSKKVRDGFWTIASVKLSGEGMGNQMFSCHPLILGIGGIKYGGKVAGRSGGASCLTACGHCHSRRKSGDTSLG